MNRDDFLSANEQPLAVEVPEWKTTVYLRVMSMPERIAWAEFLNGDPNARVLNAAALLARCLCDDKGARIFSDSIDDVNAIAAKNFIIIDRIGIAALKLNNLIDNEQKKTDSPDTQSRDSSTTSQPIKDAA